MTDLSQYEIWFVTGSQHLYGAETLERVASDSIEIASALNASSEIPVTVKFKAVGERSETIRSVCLEANSARDCIGLVIWCHTFSPAKMWIGGLKALNKPFLHLHTQYHRDLPWRELDMDYMNLHQSAHGDREFGFICSRLRIDRKVVVGHWQDPEAQRQIGDWSRAAAGHQAMQGARICRIGDNMREVSVTEGDKVSAESVFGYSVNGYGVGAVAALVDGFSDAEVDVLCASYEHEYEMAEDLRKGGARHSSVRDAARIELGLRAFLEEHGAVGFTTTFEDLVGLKQLPGIAVQRLMGDGYGFGAEGDWKAAALLRTMKVMATGLKEGTSFIEDYTYHLNPKSPKTLGSHMLEVCPTIADGKPRLEVHPLGIGGKEDPARLVFDVAAGPAVNATVIDLGDRFRFVVNDVDLVAPDAPLPKLPVARAVWQAKPDFKTAAASWIYAGGSHHPIISKALKSDVLRDFATIAGVEMVLVDEATTTSGIRSELRFNDVAYGPSH